MVPIRVGLCLTKRCRRRTLSPVVQKSCFSTWKYPDLAWARNNTKEAKPSKESLFLAKRKKNFEAAVKDQVRAHLTAKFPDAFSVKSHFELMASNTEEHKMSPKMETLAALNGYDAVSTPKSDEIVSLAEGVVAKPNYYSRISRSGETKFVLLVQPMDAYARPVPKKSLPEIIEEDATIYRILENQAQHFLNASYDRVQTWFSSKTAKIEHAVKSLDADQNQAELAKGLQPTDTLPVKQDESSSKENFLVMSDKTVVLISDMTPSVRLLALPHTLVHKSASTLISASFVVFGALPLAYRSLNFALIYPGLSELIAASVVGTVSYGIWSTRSMARTSQSQIVSNGILHRIHARDNAVLLVLQEGAAQRVAQAVLALYYHYPPVETAEPGKKRKQIVRLVRALPMLPKTLVDPLEVAIELGLVHQNDFEDYTEFKSVALDQAFTILSRPIG